MTSDVTTKLRSLFLSSGATLAIMAGAAVAETPVDFNIESQPLSSALSEFAKQSDQEILFSTDAVEGKKAAPVSGAYEPGEALRALLAGTGLSYSRTDSNTYLVKASTAQAQSTRQADASDGGNDADRPGSVTGAVIDEQSGGNLKGALVEIEETGQTTRTDDLGNFRFPSLRPGSYTLRISYLGYRDVEAQITISSGRASDLRFAMVGGAGGDTIVVYGSRSARAQALNQERTAENSSTVLSSDLLGDYTGTTLSESLRRAPGVIFQRDLDTGDGTNIVIRGLEPDLNTIKLNGIELPEGSGEGRSASLSNILTESISKVTISKTLLPNQDSAGTGGLVEIETKTPFDRSDRYASFTLEDAKRAKNFNDEFIAAGTLSAIFGDKDQFGLGASVQYRDRSVKRIAHETSLVYGEFLPLQADGSPNIFSPVFLNPGLHFPFEPEAASVYPNRTLVNLDETDTTNLSLTLSGAWRPAEHTELFLDYQRLRQEDTTFKRQADVVAGIGYTPMPIAELGGEVRPALFWRDSRISSFPGYDLFPDQKTKTDVISFKGETNLDKWRFSYLAGYTNGRNVRDEYSLIMTFRQNFTPDLVDPAAIDPVEGRVILPFPTRTDNSFPLPLFTDEGYALLNDPSRYEFGRGVWSRNTGRNERITGEFSAVYAADAGILTYIEAGVVFESSDFRDRRPLYDEFWDVGNLNIGQLGVEFTEAGLGDIGLDIGYDLISRKALEQLLYVDLPEIAVDFDLNDPSTYSPPVVIYRQRFGEDPLYESTYTRENEIAGYLQSRFDIGKLEVIGGVRLSRFHVKAVNISAPRIYDENFQELREFFEENASLSQEEATQTKFLPRVVANYRYNDNMVLRGGYYVSIARPQIANLSDATNIQLINWLPNSPNADRPSLLVQKGNPELEPARTQSFDASAEYYDDNIGVIKLGAFYKKIDNLLENNVSTGGAVLDDVADLLPDDPRFQDVLNNPDNYYVVVTTPQNNGQSAHIWGIETAIEKQFTFLPGFWRGFGVYANYTYTESSKTQPVTFSYNPVLDSGGNLVGFEEITVNIPDTRFNGQAKHSGTVGMTYNQYGVDANLAYTAQARRQTAFRSHNLSEFEEAYDTLDFRVEYRFDRGPGNFRVYVEGADLLRGVEDPSRETSRGADDGITGKYYTGASYFGGRQIRAGVAATF